MLVPLEQKFAGGLVFERNAARVEKDRELVPRALDGNLCVIIPREEIDLFAISVVEFDFVELLTVTGYGIPYISIAVVYESLARATTVRNDCR